MERAALGTRIGFGARTPALRGTWSSADELQSRAVAQQRGFIGQLGGRPGRIDLVDFAPPNPRTGFIGGEAKVLGHRLSYIPEDEWLAGVRRVASDPDIAEVTRRGGYYAYGYVRGEPLKVVVGSRAEGIVTGYRIELRDMPFRYLGAIEGAYEGVPIYR